MGKAIINKESMTFHWLCPCQERKGIFLFPVGLYIIAECGSLIQSPSSLIEVSVYCSFFFFFLQCEYACTWAIFNVCPSYKCQSLNSCSVRSGLFLFLPLLTSLTVLCHSVVSDSVAPWTVAHQVPLSMEFSRQKYWNSLPFSAPGDLSDLGIEPMSLACPALAGEFFTTVLPGKPSPIGFELS